MKQLLIILFLLPIISFAQGGNTFFKIDVKPIDPKEGYIFNIYKTKDEIKIEYKKIDSIGKFAFDYEDKKIVSRLIRKTEMDSLTKDSIDYYQRKLDTTKAANTFYKQENITVYKSTHKTYFKLIGDIVKTQDSILVKPQGNLQILPETYCFFTIEEGNNKEKRNFYIERLDVKFFPLLSKFVNETEAIAVAFKAVRERKNNK